MVRRGHKVIVEAGERLVLHAVEGDMELVAQETFVKIDVIESTLGGSSNATRIDAGMPRRPEHQPREVIERISGQGVAPIEHCADPVLGGNEHIAGQ